MRFPFLDLSGEGFPRRPAVPITIAELPDAPQPCLVDSGSLRNRFGAWIAEAAGISLKDAPHEQVAVGGLVTSARMARIDLLLAGARFDAPVWFCDPWPHDFHLLGQEGFFRYFRVTICAAEEWLECVPEIVES